MNQPNGGVINADLETMYRAAKIDIPEKARAISDAAAELSAATSTLNTQSALCSDPPSMVDLLGTHDLLYEALRRCVATMNDASTALVDAADMLGNSDDTSRQELNSLTNQFPHLEFGSPPPQVAEPPQEPGSADYGAPGVTDR